MKAERQTTYHVDQYLLVTEHDSGNISLHDQGIYDDSFRICFNPGSPSIMECLEKLCAAYRKSIPKEDMIERNAELKIIRHGNGEIWLRFSPGEDGDAKISLASIAGNAGPIVKKVLNAWAKKQLGE